MAEIAQQELAQEVGMVPDIVEDSTPVVLQDEIKPEREAILSNNAARSAKLMALTTLWFPLAIFIHPHRDGTACNREIDAVGSHSHEEIMVRGRGSRV